MKDSLQKSCLRTTVPMRFPEALAAGVRGPGLSGISMETQVPSRMEELEPSVLPPTYKLSERRAFGDDITTNALLLFIMLPSVTDTSCAKHASRCSGQDGAALTSAPAPLQLCHQTSFLPFENRWFPGRLPPLTLRSLQSKQ